MSKRNRNIDFNIHGGPAIELILAVERFIYNKPYSHNEELHFEELYNDDFLTYCLESKDINPNTCLHKVLLYLAHLEFSLYVYDDINWISDYTDFQKYAIEMFNYMYSEVPAEFHSNSEKIVMEARKEYYDKFQYGLNFIVDSAFAQLWTRKAFLLDFNMMCAERISGLSQLEYPVLEKDGRLTRATYFPRWLVDLIIKREFGCCHYCSKPVVMPNLTNKVYDIDHVIPIARGGSNDPTNFALSCPDCNNRKRVDTILIPDTFAWPERNLVKLSD